MRHIKFLVFVLMAALFALAACAKNTPPPKSADTVKASDPEARPAPPEEKAGEGSPEARPGGDSGDEAGETDEKKGDADKKKGGSGATPAKKGSN